MNETSHQNVWHIQMAVNEGRNLTKSTTRRSSISHIEEELIPCLTADFRNLKVLLIQTKVTLHICEHLWDHV